MHGKNAVCVQSKVLEHAGPVLHTQWAMCLWEQCVSKRSSRNESVFFQALLLLPAWKTAHISEQPKESHKLVRGLVGAAAQCS